MTSQLDADATSSRTSLVGRMEERARAAAGLALQRWNREPGAADPLRLLAGTAALQGQRSARHTFRHLWDAEVSVFSQWGEDGILSYLCDVLDLIKPRALELGAGNFTECNTRFLAEHRSASVVAVDGRADLASAVRSSGLEWKTSILAMRQWITPDNVGGICSRARSFMGGIDILSLDIDGNDYWVAQAVDLTEVSIVVVEYNAIFGSDAAVTVPRNDRFDRTQAHFSWLYYGASLRAFVNLFEARGLVFVGTNRVGTNAFFVRRAEAGAFDLPLPQLDDLSGYVDLRLRESRDAAGGLSYLSGSARREAVEALPLIDLLTDEQTTLADLTR